MHPCFGMMGIQFAGTPLPWLGLFLEVPLVEEMLCGGAFSMRGNFKVTEIDDVVCVALASTFLQASLEALCLASSSNTFLSLLARALFSCSILAWRGSLASWVVPSGISSMQGLFCLVNGIFVNDVIGSLTRPKTASFNSHSVILVTLHHNFNISMHNSDKFTCNSMS